MWKKMLWNGWDGWDCGLWELGIWINREMKKNEINREMNWARKVGKSIKSELKDGSIEGV